MCSLTGKYKIIKFDVYTKFIFLLHENDKQRENLI